MLANTNPVHPDEQVANTMKRTFLDAFEQTANVYKSAKSAGIARITVYDNWLREDSEFKAEFDALRQGHIAGIEGNLLSQGLHNEKAITAQIFALKAWIPERYGDRYETRLNSQDSLNIATIAGALADRARQVLAVPAEYIVVDDVRHVPGLSIGITLDETST